LQTEKELESAASIERKVMVPMRDGVRLATDIYRPKNATGKVPVIWVRTPYNFNFWDVRNGLPADMKAALTAVKRGYAYVVENERGHFFSEGNYDILGAPRNDGYDAIAWLSSQPWANGKVGTTGCSSTAEYQMGIAAMGHPAYAAMNVQGFGAGAGASRHTTSRATGIAAGPFKCCLLPGSMASRTRSGRCSRRILRRKI
jgi:predicted acyl esterase